MASTYEVKVVPNTQGFMDALREQLSSLPSVGFTTVEVEEFEYDEGGAVVKRTRTTSVAASPSEVFCDAGGTVKLVGGNGSVVA